MNAIDPILGRKMKNRLFTSTVQSVLISLLVHNISKVQKFSITLTLCLSFRPATFEYPPKFSNHVQRKPEEFIKNAY
jgi:hypothetical protein